MEKIEIKVWFTDNLSKHLQFLYVTNDMIGMIKCKIGSDGRKYLKTGLRKRKKYSNEKAELCFNELFHYLLDKENTEKKAKDCSFHLEINLFKGKGKTWYYYDESNMDIVIEKLSELFWGEFNDVYYLDFLKPNKIEKCSA